MLNTLSSVSVRESLIQYLCDPQWFRDTASRGPTTIVAVESQFRTCPSDHDNIGYPRMSASGESSTTMHRLLNASGSHPIPPPNDPNFDSICLEKLSGWYKSLEQIWRVRVLLRDLFSDLYRDTLATVHRTLSSSIADGRQLRLNLLAFRPSLLGCEICIARTQFVVIVAQRLEGACRGARVTPVPHLHVGTVSHRIQLAVGPQPLWLRNHNSGPAQRIMVKRLATSPHDPLGITDSACKNQSIVVSVQYGPFNPYIPIRSTTIGKSRVAIDPIAMHTSCTTIVESRYRPDSYAYILEIE
ncbi:hypothetical protein F511_27760 [Dorcoceras hygrometricum]|uniref:Uncharacterized protein n=1 Tax=Dorcoceras hygrometricum TaxID=472368 RepID=A0A2Z7B2B3_9LAMI|nr:hypothetical protein F511_27760 [Dorcoceras hygrometricum]